jgi:hypothetical protein
MNDQEQQECRRVAAMMWTFELISRIAPTEDEASRLIILAASYEPACRTHGQRSRS